MGRPLYPLPPQVLPTRPWPWWPWLALAGLILAGMSNYHLGLDLAQLAHAGTDLREYASRFNGLTSDHLGVAVHLMGQTLAMALWGTLLAAAFAVVLAPLACRALTPHPVCYHAARTLLVVMRAIPDLVLALLLVVALGLGPLPGVVALGIHCTGFLGKFYAECMERVDKGVYDALRSTGAGWMQVVALGGWPSIQREAVGYLCYILDRNVRMSTALALVGAGGIGAELEVDLHLYQYRHALTILLLIFVVLLLVEHASSWIRSRLT